MARAVALLSGGLDSTLSVLVMLRQGIDVTAVTFLTHFGCEIADRSSCSSDPSSNARKFGFDVKLCHLADKFIAVVKNPKYGRGRNMNPCMDCRVLMLREAKELMGLIGADFIITGEVLGQRPMTQRRETLPFIDRQAGLEGYVLRPLSARLLKPTIPELEGIVERERLYGMHGRGRKPQMALAKELGLTDYPAPAGGCLLTEPNYSYRLRELLRRNPNPTVNDLHLLRVGRHFSLTDALLIVGRDKAENDRLEALALDGDCLLRADCIGTPIGLLRGNLNEEDILKAASITVRYSDLREMPLTPAIVTHGGRADRIEVAPAGEGLIEALRVQKGAGRIKVL